jgi:hypothetical protein
MRFRRTAGQIDHLCGEDNSNPRLEGGPAEQLGVQAVAGAESAQTKRITTHKSYKKKEYTCRFCSSPCLPLWLSPILLCPYVSVSRLSSPSSTRFSRENREGCGEQRRDEEEEDRAGLPPDAGAARRRRGCCVLPACNTTNGRACKKSAGKCGIILGASGSSTWSWLVPYSVRMAARI